MTFLSGFLKAVEKHAATKIQKAKRHNRKTKTFIHHNTQCQFKKCDQTAVVLDWDDTLFPTSFLKRSGFQMHVPVNQQQNVSEEVLNEVLEAIDECQATAESLLRCAQNFGRIIIVTLSSRIALRQCARLYPRVFDFLKVSQISIVHALDYKPEDSVCSGAQLKAIAISRELDRFYSQYKGQSWKNIVSIGDSNSERYGTLGATHAYVQKRFRDTKISPLSDERAYVEGWQCFDRDPDWSQRLEGVHEGHMFKVRTKVVKLLDAPSSTDLAQQMTLLTQWFPLIVWHDDSLDLVFNDLREETVESFESALAACARSDLQRPHSPLMLLSVPNPAQLPAPCFKLQQLSACERCED
jgi:hypothetical protein